jgi:ectoine hydroxylase-related dioxygenase (phytanoyl-CoA dioxygenase family)
MTLPLIRLSDIELTSSTLHPATRLLAQQVFASKGVLVIENAFAPELIKSLRNAFVSDYARHLIDRETDESLRVGDKRILVPVKVTGAFNTPQLYANPFVFPLVQDLLGAECVLGSFGAITALPGAEDQRIHRDHPFLFHEEVIDTLMPVYAVTAIVPLVDVDEYRGTTRVWPGSHRVWQEGEAAELSSEDPVARVGSCILMDYRLLHGGTANRSEQVRPILYIVYHRSWFKDYVNILKVKELCASAKEFANIPQGYQRWFTACIDK